MLPKLVYRGGFRILHVRSQCPSLTTSTPPSDRMTIPPSGILESLSRTVVWSALDISTHMNAVGLIETCHFSTALAGASRAVHWALWALTRPHTSNLMTKLTVAPPWSTFEAIMFNCCHHLPQTPQEPRASQSLPHHLDLPQPQSFLYTFFILTLIFSVVTTLSSSPLIFQGLDQVGVLFPHCVFKRITVPSLSLKISVIWGRCHQTTLLVSTPVAFVADPPGHSL